jgi:hypothetical protein
LNPQVDGSEKFSNRDLRRARMELMFKDYEVHLEITAMNV